MNWKQDVDRLMRRTMALAQEMNAQPVVQQAPTALTTTQRVTEIPKPIDTPVKTLDFHPSSGAREEIRQRVSNFRAHQVRFRREREAYAASELRRMLAGQKHLD